MKPWRLILFALLFPAYWSLLNLIHFSSQIPCHGFILELTLPEWAIILWLPLAPLLFHRSSIPRRWWVYFGFFAFMLFWPTLKWFIFTAYHSGRRPWLPACHPELETCGFLAYFLLAPLCASALRISDSPNPTKAVHRVVLGLLAIEFVLFLVSPDIFETIRRSHVRGPCFFLLPFVPYAVWMISLRLNNNHKSR